MLKAIKIQLYPDLGEINYVNNLLGCSRFVYNNILNYTKEQYENNKKSISLSDQGKELTRIKNDFPWLREAHSKVLQQSLIDLNRAYSNFFKNKNGYPKFKSRHENKLSCRFPKDAISSVGGNRINLTTQLRDIHYKCSKRDEKYLNKYKNNIKSATLTKTKSGRYFLSILVDGDSNKKLNKPKNDFIGLDLGIKDFIITSEGKTFENIKIKRNNQNKIAKLHRELSKKKKGSSNRNKTRIKLARYYEKLNNKKENYLHHVTNQLLDENQVIIIENLSVSNMIKNHKLARSLQELSLYRFKEMLKYKSEWCGRDVVEVDRFFPSSKLCSNCGYKNINLTLSDREWRCPECNKHHDRDYNAAVNILNEGKRIFLGLSSPELTPLESHSLEHSLN